jgi:predicted O-linked N-acetylglucosamine transferase (SPINDLY family)
MLTLTQALEQAENAFCNGDSVRAEQLCRMILDTQAHHFDALTLLGILTAQTGRITEAATFFGRAVAAKPADAEAHYRYGCLLEGLKRPQDALASYDRAVEFRPDYAEAYYQRGNALADLQRFDEAVDSYDRALQAKPDYPEAYFNRGVAQQTLKRNVDAAESYERAVQLKPDYARAYANLGNALAALGRVDQALASYERALKIKPDLVEAYVNRGVALQALKRFDDALGSYECALQLNPHLADAYYNRAVALQGVHRLRDALDSCETALRIRPDYAKAYECRGHLLRDLGRHEAAIESYDRALALDPDLEFLFGLRRHVKMKICDWSDFETDVAEITARVARNEAASMPFPLLALADSTALQKKAAAIWVRERCPTSHALPAIDKRAKCDKIRIGYFSADFRDHPVSSLTAELFEIHDRSRFEVCAFSFGPNTRDEMRKRMERAFDRFIDVAGTSDRDIALLARALQLDIAVDLGGFTGDGATSGVFALRAAPLQVSYIGYLGTMAAEFMDYLVADKTLVPLALQDQYSEKIIYLPSYQANDSKRSVSDRRFTREELGLPPCGFVFCCFNANYKITPETFDSWMRILRSVEGSVLLLSADSETGAINLRKEALRRGVDAERLVFRGRLPIPDYLARYRAADLFLDTLPYNAGTTASDALWSGLPVLTLMGETFAGRVAASLLNAIRLPELITTSREQYEALAVELATKPTRLAQIRRALASNCSTTPLFDTPLFASRLESAYASIHERYQADLPPQHIFVDSL